MLDRLISFLKALVATTLLILNIVVAFSIVFPWGGQTGAAISRWFARSAMP